jgi:dTDP-4-dehydrorhamnose 3,5-epimerase-like enzyme
MSGGGGHLKKRQRSYMQKLDKSRSKDYHTAKMSRLERVDNNSFNEAGISDQGGEISRQEYAPVELPEDVVGVKTDVFKDEFGGHFLETARFSNSLVGVLSAKGIDLSVENGQTNAAWIAPGTERFGHLHRDQDEMWMVTKGVLTVALYDAREGGKTYGLKAKLVLSEGRGIRIPPGVVHGLANYTEEGVMLNYFADHHFSAGEDTQEWRFVPEEEGFWDFAKPDKV